MDDTYFEQEVRRVARELWPSADVSGARNFGQRERDGLFTTADAIYVIEATTSRKKDKVEVDCKKTSELVKKFCKESGKFSRGFVVTLNDPTADQHAAAKKYVKTVALLSFNEFCSQLMNVPLYFSLRDKMIFGSIQNTLSNTVDVPRHEFVEPTIDDGDSAYSIESIQHHLERGGKYCIVADFGSGKSMACRELYYRLRETYERKLSFKFPIYINLREHSGAEFEVELLERHARKIGYPEPTHLVRAWRAGFAHLILDGFDEMIGRGVSPSPTAMREYRRQILYPVKTLIRQTPKGASVLTCGRAGFFDTAAEREDALGLKSGFKTVYVRPFNEDQVIRLMKTKHLQSAIPPWLPRTPLLLSYLISRGYLTDLAGNHESSSRGRAWIDLVEMICSREADQVLSLDEQSTKFFFERLSTKSRSALDSTAVLDSTAIASVFRQVARREPIADDWQLILRLPGLGPSQGSESDRIFVDSDLAAAGTAGDVARFIDNPFAEDENKHLNDVVAPLNDLGQEVVSEYLSQSGRSSEGVLSAALEAASRQQLFETAIDVLSIMGTNGYRYLSGGIDIIDGHLDEIDISTLPEGSNNISFYTTYLRSAYLPIDTENTRVPKFRDCWFGSIIGRISERDLPAGRFEYCAVDRFLAVFDSIEESYREYPVALQALIACMQKLFFQAGSGRLESAFSRGLNERVALVIPDVLKLINSHGFAFPTRIRGRTIWLPNRELTSRASEIVNRPSESRDPLIVAALSLK